MAEKRFKTAIGPIHFSPPLASAGELANRRAKKMMRCLAEIAMTR